MSTTANLISILLGDRAAVGVNIAVHSWQRGQSLPAPARVCGARDCPPHPHSPVPTGTYDFVEEGGE
jgi:hypothetical protein